MKPASILILRLSSLGDVIHTLPAAEALRRAFPGARLGWVVERHYEELVRITSPVDEVFVAATKSWRKRPFGGETRAELFGLARAMRAFVRDGVAIDFQGLLKSAVVGMISGARARFGFEAAHVKEKAARLFYSHTVPIDPSRHVIEWNVALAAGVAGVRMGVPDIRIDRLAADPTGKLATIVRDAPVVLFPGAGRPEKVWPVERFGDLAKLLRERAGRKCVVAWGPGEERMAREIAARGEALLAPSTDLRELAFLISRAAAFVAADTGPLHLSAAIRTPTVGLFGPTDPRRNGPWRQTDDCVETHSTTQSMTSIEVEGVLDRIVSVLARNAA